MNKELLQGCSVRPLHVREEVQQHAMAEDYDDIAAAQAAENRRADGEEYVPFSLVESIIAGENALRAWRAYRGLTLEALADRVGSSKSALSDMENGKAQGKPELWRKLAEALNVTVDEILPE